MKKALLFAIALILAVSFTSCAEKTDGTLEAAAEMLTTVKTTQYFTEESVAEADIHKILEAGVNAPSAINSQPWHFTAITDKETTKRLSDAMGSMKPPAGA